MAQQVVRSGVVSVAISRLRLRPSFREGGVSSDHVRRLARLGGRWPPILVDRFSGVVIDGVHRVAAARVLGMEQIDASLFSGGPNEAMIEFVRRNVNHGLPLTLRERKAAAGRVLEVHPEWSDRRIAEICALSPKTVGRLRGLPAGSGEEVPRLDATARVGRDNRVRAVNNAPARARVIQAIREQPEASLRSVAAAVGVSPETVRSVRLSLSEASVAERVVEPDAECAPTVRHGVVGRVVEPDAECALAAEPQLALDAAPALEATRDPVSAIRRDLVPLQVPGSPEGFAAWFERTSVGEVEWSRWAEVVPSNRMTQVVAEARRRAEIWLDFARALERRTAVG